MIVRLEDPDGRLVTYATARVGVMESSPVQWRDRVFFPFGQFRDAKNPELPFDDPRQPQAMPCFREHRDHDANDPVTCVEINDAFTPRKTP